MVNAATRTYIELLLMSAIWGSSFLFLRIAAPEFGPFLLIQMRVLTAVIVMLPICVMFGKLGELAANWRVIFLVSLMNMAVPFCLFAYAALFMGSGLLSIMNATVPFFTALIGFAVFGQRLSSLSLFGMAVGFSGVIVLVFDPDAIDLAEGGLLAVSAALSACFLYGMALNLVSRRLTAVSGLAITTGSLLFASVLLVPFSTQSLPDKMPDISAWAAVAALGIGCTGLAYLMFYRLIARIGSDQTIMTAYLIPLFSLLWGSLFLSESITVFTVLGCLLVLLGVGMTTGKLSGLVRRVLS
ncbi:MAG: DMT family transporter [Pseudomonadota bacterium]|nr:DMT family transporter [Pseudomonadota bacterium]